MIVNFSVENFRSTRERVTLSFEATKSTDLEEYYVVTPVKGLRLLKMGIIYGANASGKTTVLQALDFLRTLAVKPLMKKTDKFCYEPFLFDETSRDKNTFFVLEFVQNGIKYLYELELNKYAVLNEALYYFNPNKALVYKRKTDTDKQLTEINFGSKIKIRKESVLALAGNTLWNNTVIGGYLKTNFESEELQNVLNWFDKRLKPLIHPRTRLVPLISEEIDKGTIDKKTLVKILQKADFGISDIVIKKLSVNDESTESETIKILLQHSVKHTAYVLSVEDESAGTIRYYGLSGILSMIINERSILTIDELESSLHPDLIKHFILTFLVNSKHSQLIATTHHRELLMEKDILRDDVIWFTEKREDSSTDLYSLADFDTSVIRKTSSFYNAYKIGKLGAVPNIDDYYIEFENGEN